MPDQQRSVVVRLSADVAGYIAKMRAAGAATESAMDQADDSGKKASSSIDKLSGRLRILLDTAMVLGPALIPLGTTAAAGVSGLASQFGFAATAGGVFAGSMYGVKDALTAVNKAGLDPTAANLEAARAAMSRLTPEGRSLVYAMRDLGPALTGVRDAGQSAIAPGLIDGMRSIRELLPGLEAGFRSIGATLGGEFAAGAASLNTDRWQPFIAFLSSNASPALQDMSATAVSLTHALAELWMAMDPINDDFSTGLRDGAAALDAWASGLSRTEGYRDFLAYVRETGPQVLDTLGSLANMLLQMGEAAAPLGGPVLRAISGVADAVAMIADSPLGTPLAALAMGFGLVNRAASLAGGSVGDLLSRLTTAGAAAAGMGRQVAAVPGQLSILATTARTAGATSQRELARANAASAGLRTTMSQVGRGAAGVLAAAAAMGAFGDSAQQSNAIMLGLAGSMAGPWGAAAGATVGSIMDIKSAVDDLSASTDRMEELTGQVLFDPSKTGQAISQLDDLKSRYEDLTSFDVLDFSFGGDWSGIGTGKKLWSEFTGETDRAAAAVRGAESAIADAGSVTAASRVAALGYAESMGLVSDGVRDSASAMYEYAAANKAMNSQLDRRDAALGYADALSTLTQGLRRNGDSFSLNSAAGRENRRNIDSLIRSAMRMSETLRGQQKLRPFLDLRGDLRRLRGDFPGVQNGLGRLDRIINRLARRHRATLDMNDTGFNAAVRRANSDLSRFDKRKTRAHIDADVEPLSGATKLSLGYLDKVQKKKTKPKIDADTGPAERGAEKVGTLWDRVNRMRANPTVDADTGPAMSGINNVQSALSGLHDKTVTITTHYRTTGNPGANRMSSRSSVPAAPGRVARTPRVWDTPGDTSPVDRTRTTAVPWSTLGTISPAAPASTGPGFPSTLRLVGTVATAFGPGDIDAIAEVAATRVYRDESRYTADRARLSGGVA